MFVISKIFNLQIGYPSLRDSKNIPMRQAMLNAKECPIEWIDRNIPANNWANILFIFGGQCARKKRKERPPMETIFKVNIH